MKECCKDLDNRTEPVASDIPDEVIQKCKICGCRHFNQKMDTGRLGLKFLQKPEDART